MGRSKCLLLFFLVSASSVTSLHSVDFYNYVKTSTSTEEFEIYHRILRVGSKIRHLRKMTHFNILRRVILHVIMLVHIVCLLHALENPESFRNAVSNTQEMAIVLIC